MELMDKFHSFDNKSVSFSSVNLVIQRLLPSFSTAASLGFL